MQLRLWSSTCGGRDLTAGELLCAGPRFHTCCPTRRSSSARAHSSPPHPHRAAGCWGQREDGERTEGDCENGERGPLSISLRRFGRIAPRRSGLRSAAFSCFQTCVNRCDSLWEREVSSRLSRVLSRLSRTLSHLSKKSEKVCTRARTSAHARRGALTPYGPPCLLYTRTLRSLALRAYATS